MVGSLPVVNLDEATFECTYGRGCDGLCCRNGRPMLYPEEVERLDAHLERAMLLLTPRARRLIEQEGYLSRRRKEGHPMLRVIDGWCVFFNEGCVLHKLGAAEGDAFRYKPVECALFPLAHDEKGRWYVRQHGFKGESWDLFCLDPKNSTKKASETLQAEIELARRFTEE